MWLVNSNDEPTFPHKLLLEKTQSSKICKASANGLSSNIKLSKPRLSKMKQLGRNFPVDDFFEPLGEKGPIENSLVKKIKNIHVKDLENKDAVHIFSEKTVDTISEKFKGEIAKHAGSGITLTSNEIKDIIKVIRSSGNKGSL